MSDKAESSNFLIGLAGEHLHELDALEARKAEIMSWMEENTRPLLRRFRDFVLRELKKSKEEDAKAVRSYKSTLLRNFGINEERTDIAAWVFADYSTRNRITIWIDNTDPHAVRKCNIPAEYFESPDLWEAKFLKALEATAQLGRGSEKTAKGSDSL